MDLKYKYSIANFPFKNSKLTLSHSDLSGTAPIIRVNGDSAAYNMILQLYYSVSWDNFFPMEVTLAVEAMCYSK